MVGNQETSDLEAAAADTLNVYTSIMPALAQPIPVSRQTTEHTLYPLNGDYCTMRGTYFFPNSFLHLVKEALLVIPHEEK